MEWCSEDDWQLTRHHEHRHIARRHRRGGRRNDISHNTSECRPKEVEETLSSPVSMPGVGEGKKQGPDPGRGSKEECRGGVEVESLSDGGEEKRKLQETSGQNIPAPLVR